METKHLKHCLEIVKICRRLVPFQTLPAVCESGQDVLQGEEKKWPKHLLWDIEMSPDRDSPSPSSTTACTTMGKISLSMSYCSWRRPIRSCQHECVSEWVNKWVSLRVCLCLRKLGEKTCIKKQEAETHAWSATETVEPGSDSSVRTLRNRGKWSSSDTMDNHKHACVCVCVCKCKCMCM